MIVKLPNGSTAEFPDDMAPDQVESVLQKQFPSAAPDSQAIPESSFQQAPVEQPKIAPDFLKKLDMINTGVDRGVKNFTLSLMSKLPFGDKYQQAIKNVDAASTAEQEYNKKTYKGVYPQIGEVGGELLATAPLGGVLGKIIGKGVSIGAGEAIAPSISKMALPGLLQTPAKYAIAGAGGLATNVAMESQRYDPEHPGQLINQAAVDKLMSDPMSVGLSAGLPMVGAAAGSYARNAGKLGEYSDILGQTPIPRNTMPDGAKKSFYQSVFGTLPAMTWGGAQAAELKNIGTPVWNFISKFADQPMAQNADDIMKAAGKTVQNSLRSVKQSVSDSWNQPFKLKPVENTSGVLTDAHSALNLIDEVKQAIPSAGLYTSLIKRTLNKVERSDSAILDRFGNAASGAAKFSVEDVKNIQSNLGSAISKIKKEAGSNEIVDSLSALRDNLYTHMTDSLNPAERTALETAKTQSKLLYDLKSNSPLVEKAMVSEVQARNLVRKLISPSEPVDKQMIFNQMTQDGQKQVAAAKVAQMFKSSNDSTGFNIDKFVTAVQNSSDLSPLMGSETYKSLDGLNTYLKSVSQGSKTSAWKGIGVGAAIGIPAVMSGVGPLAAAGAVATLGAATYVANHPVIKTLLNAVNKQLPENTKTYLTKAIGNHLSRAGYLINAEGVLKHEKE